MNTLTPPSYAAGSQSLELRNIIGSPDDSAPASHTSLAGVAHEQQWCEPLHSGDGQSQILVSRWRDDRSFAREAFYTVPPDVCLIVVSLQPCLASLVLAGAKTQAQSNPAGVIKIAGPETRLKALWKEGCDELHLHCPIDLIDRIAGRAAPIATHLGKSARSSFVDASLLGLAQTLIASPSAASGFEGMFHQSVAYAIVARALLRGVYERLHESPDMGAVAPRRQQDATGLPAWRLSRVLGHIEHNLRESLSLTELAAVSGFSRMHFAALFRATTGSTPSEYVLRTRLRAAQSKLEATDDPLVDIALECGFSSQSHFTTVFRRALGETPGAWRQRTRRAPAPGQRELDMTSGDARFRSNSSVPPMARVGM